MEIETPVIDAPAPAAAVSDADMFDKAAEGAMKLFGEAEKTPVPEPAPGKEAPKPDDIVVPPIEKVEGKEGELDAKTLQDIREGKLIPKHRMDEVSEKIRRFEAFGTPEQIEAKLKAIAPAAPVAPAPAAKTPDPLSAEDQEIKEMNLKLHPELKEFPAILERLNAIEKANREQAEAFKAQQAAVEAERTKERDAYFDKAIDEAKTLAKNVGLNVDDETNVNIIMRAVMEILHANKELDNRFYEKRDLTAIGEAFKEYEKRFISGFRRQQAADVLSGKRKEATLPKAPAKGGSLPAAAPVKPAENFSDAADRAWESMHGG